LGRSAISKRCRNMQMCPLALTHLQDTVSPSLDQSLPWSEGERLVVATILLTRRPASGGEGSIVGFDGKRDLRESAIRWR
jgi:hypothetical protein